MLPWLKRKLPLTLPWLHSICSKLWILISKPYRFRPHERSLLKPPYLHRKSK
jgi:hypothetical protein